MRPVTALTPCLILLGCSPSPSRNRRGERPFAPDVPKHTKAEVVDPESASRALTTIICSCDARRVTFEIAGTDKKGVTLDDLPGVLRELHLEAPGTEYECYADSKVVSFYEDRIIDTIRRSGVTLRHYWAPSSDVPIDRAPGRYGLGHLDILRNRSDNTGVERPTDD